MNKRDGGGSLGQASSGPWDPVLPSLNWEKQHKLNNKATETGLPDLHPEQAKKNTDWGKNSETLKTPWAVEERAPSPPASFKEAPGCKFRKKKHINKM